MNKEEQEYDGGCWNFVVGLVATVVSVGVTYAASKGYISKRDAAIVSSLCDVVTVAIIGVSINTVRVGYRMGAKAAQSYAGGKVAASMASSDALQITASKCYDFAN